MEKHGSFLSKVFTHSIFGNRMLREDGLLLFNRYFNCIYANNKVQCPGRMTKCSIFLQRERERATLLRVIHRYISDSLKGVSLILCRANFERGWFEPLWNITFFRSFVFCAHSSVSCSAVVSKRKNTQEENGVHYTMTCITLRVTKPCGTVTLWPRPTDCEERNYGYDTLRSSSVYIPSYFCYDTD